MCIRDSLNPYTGKQAVRSGKDNSDDALGRVLINSENSDTQVFCSLCFEKPCSDPNNRISNYIDVNWWRHLHLH